jgi:hypothetical protein
MVMTQGIGAHLTNDEKRAHLIDVKREHLYRSGLYSRRMSIANSRGGLSIWFSSSYG